MTDSDYHEVVDPGLSADGQRALVTLRYSKSHYFFWDRWVKYQREMIKDDCGSWHWENDGTIVGAWQSNLVRGADFKRQMAERKAVT